VPRGQRHNGACATQKIHKELFTLDDTLSRDMFWSLGVHLKFAGYALAAVRSTPQIIQVAGRVFSSWR
jgi:hypothetical protein